MKKTASGLNLVDSFTNFMIPLPVTCVRHSSDVTAKDWQNVCFI